MQEAIYEVIVQRKDDSVSFYRPWADYKSGFGSLDNNYWIGLDKLNLLTTSMNFALGVNMTAWNGTSLWAYYDSIIVGPESDDYRLTISGYDIRSTASDAMDYQNNMMFSTYDRDNDKHNSDCAAAHKGGWWYNTCRDAHPTGIYYNEVTYEIDGITWWRNNHDNYSFKEMTLMLIPKGF